METKLEMKEYLSKFREPVPEWLRTYKSGDNVSFAEFMSGRVGYYPGSGYDGNLISICNRAHCVHSFLYVDYGLSRAELSEHLGEKDCFTGYHSIGRVEWVEREMTPNGCYPIDLGLRRAGTFVLKGETLYCFMEIFERDADRGDDWGAERFAVTFLFADGIATYKQLFVREYEKAPWVFLLQDHGFGCNYDRFGKRTGNRGILDRIILSSGCRPYFVICDKPDNVWSGYAQVEGVNPVVRRAWFGKQLRYLFVDKGDFVHKSL